MFPTSSALMADTLGAPNAAAYDLLAGCTGFVYAIVQAYGMLASGLCRRALVVGGDVLSSILDWEDRSTWADALRERLGFAPEELPVSLILDLARDAAKDVVRPAAPLSTFAAGLAAGRRGGSAADIAAVVEEISQLAETWNARP